MTLRITLLAATLVAGLSAPAFANQCTKHSLAEAKSEAEWEAVRGPVLERYYRRKDAETAATEPEHKADAIRPE